MSERSEGECLEILRGLGYSEAQIEVTRARYKGDLNPWVDAELAEVEEQFLGPDPAAYAADMSRPYKPPPDELLALHFIDFQGAEPEPLVAQMAQDAQSEFRRVLADYEAGHLPVSVDDLVERNGDGTLLRFVSVVTKGDESTLDLLLDHVLDIMGPTLRQQLNTVGLDRIGLQATFRNVPHWL